MMVGPFEDGPKATATECGDFVIFVVATSESIFAGAIKVMLIWHLFAEAVFCGILETFQNAIVAPAVKVNTLVPSDFGGRPQAGQGQVERNVGRELSPDIGRLGRRSCAECCRYRLRSRRTARSSQIVRDHCKTLQSPYWFVVPPFPNFRLRNKP